jgi:hypothetical protein
MFLGHGWSYPCDMWSVGCILVELCSVCVSFVLFISVPEKGACLIESLASWFFIGWDIIPDPWEFGTLGNDGESSRSCPKAHAGKNRVCLFPPVLLALLAAYNAFEFNSNLFGFGNPATMWRSMSEEEDWTGQKEQQEERALELFLNCLDFRSLFKKSYLLCIV